MFKVRSLCIKFFFLFIFFLFCNQCTTQEIMDKIAAEDQEPPEVSLVSPQNNSTVTGQVTIKALAWDNVGVVRVGFYVNGNLLGEDQVAPYNYIWDTGSVSGSYTLSVKAYDKKGNIGESAEIMVKIGKTLQVELTSPSAGTNLKGMVELAALVAGEENISKLMFFMDNQLILEDNSFPYSQPWDTTSVEDGSHSIKAVAQLESGSLVESPVILVQVKNDVAAPSVNLSAPMMNQEIQGIINLSAVASTGVTGRSIERVEFYQNNNLIGSDTSSPYQIAWDTTTVVNGTYQLMVKAYDNGIPVKASVDNDTVVVVKNPIVSTLSLTEPLGGTVSGVIAIKAQAQGEISRVAFYQDGVKISEDNQAPFEALWDTTILENKSYNLKAVGYNSAGNQVASSSIVLVSVVNQVTDTVNPELTISSPNGSGPFSGTITVAGNLSDNIGLKKVELFVDNTLRNTLDLSGKSANFNFSLGTETGDSVKSTAFMPLATGSTKEITNFGSNPGGIKMYLHTPASVNGPAPLVLALHGCTQTAVTANAGYEYLSGWSELADRYGFYVIYAEQNNNNNGNSCFNWGGDPNTTTSNMDPAGTLRVGTSYSYNGATKTNAGDESGSLMQMVDYVKTNYTIDNSKVYVTGLSAGGYMTSLLLAVYPDIFAAGAPMSGGPYLCNRLADGKFDSTEAYNCLSPGKDKTPDYWGDMVRNYSNYQKPANVSWPRVQIWQGGKYDTDGYHTVKFSGDSIVLSMNAVELMEQWTNVHGIDQTFDEQSNLKNDAKYNYRKFKDSSGRSLVEIIMIEGMGHGIAVDPNGTGEEAGGNGGAWSNSVGIWSSYYAWQFFSSDVSQDLKPFVQISNPLNGAARLDGVVSFAAEATDDKGVIRVEFYVDNGLVGTKYAAPYVLNWDTVGVSEGSHFLKVVAYDTAGQSSEQVIGVSVRKAAETPLSKGEHMLKIRVTDTSENTVEKTLNITVGTVFVCQEWTAKNIEHVASGRADNKTINYTAHAVTKGGNEDLGLLGDQYYSATSVVKETEPGVFKKGSCN